MKEGLRFLAALAAVYWLSSAAFSQSVPFVGLQVNGCTLVTAPVTLDPANKSAVVLLSGGNLTATVSSGNGDNIAKQTAPPSNEPTKIYLEVQPTAGTAVHVGVGLANASQALTDYLGDGNNSFGFYFSGIATLNNVFTTVDAAPPGTSGTYGLAFDLTAKKFWETHDGVNFNSGLAGTQNPATGVGGFDFSTVTGTSLFVSTSEGNDTVNDVETLNFGASSFAYSMPSGFSPIPATSSCAGGTPSGRSWAFLPNDDNQQYRWGGTHSGWALKPIDGIHAVTSIDPATGGCFIPAVPSDQAAWSPAPPRWMLSTFYSVPFDMSVLAAGAPGTNAYDANIKNCLRTQSALDVVIFRVFVEGNGSWFAWSVNQTGATANDGTCNGCAWSIATFQSAFQHYASDIRSVWPNAKIDFNLNSGGPFGGPGNDTGLGLWPGDAWADNISIDSYEKSVPFSTTLSGGGFNLNSMASFAALHGKTVGVGETASHNGDTTYFPSWGNWLDGEGTTALYFSPYDQGLTGCGQSPSNNSNGDNVIYTVPGSGGCGTNSNDTDAFTGLQAAANSTSWGKKNYAGGLR